MKYFNECKTLDQAKNLFRQLAHKMHPDKGGSHLGFIELLKQFKAFRPTVKNEKFTKDEETFDADRFYNAIKVFEILQNVKIDFVGTWAYVSDAEGFKGSTYNQRAIINDLVVPGYQKAKWSRSKQVWQFPAHDWSPKGKRRGQNLNKLKDKFGCQSFATESKKQLA